MSPPGSSTESVICIVHDWMQVLSELPDPRREQGKRHNLAQMVFMALVAVLSGADGFIAVERFCRTQQSWLEQFFELPYGIPTHDSFERVFAVLDPKALAKCVQQLLEGLRTKDSVIAIDGKTLRGSFDRAAQQSPLHLLHAFGTESGLVVGQESVDKKENEIVAIPRILEQFEVRGHTLTFDAMGCQKSVAQDIHERGGDYVMALKDNHPAVHEHVVKHFEFAQRCQFETTRTGIPFLHDRDQSVEGDHGRIEERCVDTLDATGEWFHHPHPGWNEGVNNFV